MSRRHVVVARSGDPCPHCGRPTEIRQRARITDRDRRRPYFYSRWFYCTNARCKTTTIVPDRYRVFNVEPEVERREANIAEQLGLSSDWITVASSAEVPW